jgi:LmbE family N-acetylglucosaminyl deacetylase
MMNKMLRQLTVTAVRRFVPTGVRNSLRLWTMLELPDRGVQSIEDFSQGPVVVIAPHMDDEVIGPGGTVVLHAQAGAAVSVLMLTDGAHGDPGPRSPDLTPDEISQRQKAYMALRKEESRESARIVGVSDLQFFDAPDGALTETPELVAKVAAALEQRQPALVYVPAVTDFHRDHWASNRVLRAALDQLSGELCKKMIIRGYEIWSTLPANRVADISAVAKIKEQAIGAFVSQTKSVDLAGAALGLNRYRSMARSCGHGYSEGFLETTVAEYTQLFDIIALRRNGKSGDFRASPS